jgi:hypothetical protein
MERTLKDEVLIRTIREWVTITGYSDDEILKWSVKHLRDRLREAQGATGPYWRIFLRRLKRNLEKRFFEVFSSHGYPISEANVMRWPRALEDPNSSAAEAELDDVADQINVEIR